MPILYLTITQSSDDAHQNNAGGVTTNAANASASNANAWYGFRVQGAEALAGCVINAAPASLVIPSGNSSPACDIYGEAADNAATYDTTASGISSRTRTAEKVNWTGTALGSGRHSIGDLKEIVQKIVDRPGFAGVLNFILDTLTGYSCNLRFWDGDPDGAFQIAIDYTPPSSGMPVKAVYYARMRNS